ncbi:MAG TPA: hypothetical protein VGS12_02450 [Caulobacteraceae bacterium]|nr:hypothetical protein [Caulobacteraceae bacterium]
MIAPTLKSGTDMRLIHLVAAAAVFLAAPALALAADPGGDASSPAQAAVTKASVRKPHDADKLICKQVQDPDEQYMGGSRLGGSRECRTQAEWDTLSHDAGDQLNQIHQTTSGH